MRLCLRWIGIGNKAIIRSNAAGYKAVNAVCIYKTVLLRPVDLVRADVSEERIASIIRMT
jgi:hypothetical protein